MTLLRMGKPSNFRARKKIAWISFLILDIHLHRTSQLEILNELAKRGYDTSLIAVRSKNVFPTRKLQVRITSVPLRYVPVISPLMFAIAVFLFLPFYIIVSKPDFIIGEPDSSIFGFISALPFSKLIKTKFILDIRSIPVETVGLQGFLQSFCFASSVFMARRFFDGMTIITSPMKEEVCKRFNLSSKLVGVWSSGVSAALFNPENYVSERVEVRRKLGLSEKFVVFYHGAFSANRGLMETIKAISIVKRVYSNVFFFLLGDGPISKTLKDLIRVLELQDNVIIHDAVEYTDVPKHIAACDVGIVPLPNLSYWRFQCPLKLLEYLSMEKVVIMTDIPAHRLIVGEEECGIYISSIKPTEIAKAIEYVYLNKDSLKERGKIGREIVKREYTWEKVAGSLENYLLSIYELRKNRSNSCHKGL